MKKYHLVLLAFLPLFLIAQPVKTLKKNMELKMPVKTYTSQNTGEDSFPGKRGAAVVWHPLQKKYYAAFAGNETFPFSVFDISGKRISADDQSCLVDTRGLWYDPVSEKICGNGYSDIGWFYYNLDSKGIPASTTIIAGGLIQPDVQSIGVYNAKSKLVCFLYGPQIYTYNTDGILEDDSATRLYPGISIKENIELANLKDDLDEKYNWNALIYTGIPKAEFGLLNTDEKQIELYNRKTGLLTMILKLPDDAETYTAFNFSYANGFYWLFNQDTRTWSGYK
jgi:hypothetical protein